MWPFKKRTSSSQPAPAPLSPEPVIPDNMHFDVQVCKRDGAEALLISLFRRDKAEPVRVDVIWHPMTWNAAYLQEQVKKQMNSLLSQEKIINQLCGTYPPNQFGVQALK